MWARRSPSRQHAIRHAFVFEAFTTSWSSGDRVRRSRGLLSATCSGGPPSPTTAHPTELRSGPHLQRELSTRTRARGVKAAERKGTTGREGATERGALDLLRHVYLESLFQDALEAKGYRSPTWRILRALQATINANVVIGESRLTAAPFFEGAGRPSVPFWGPQQGWRVILWESLSSEDQQK